MAYTYANAPFDFGALDLDWYGANIAAVQFLDNAGTSIEGTVYEDVVAVRAQDGSAHLIIYFGGTGFAFNGSGQASGGTVTGLYQYDVASGQFTWGVTGISLPATAVYAAFVTASNADDVGLLLQALSGADAIDLSDLADNAFGGDGDDTIFGYGGGDTISGDGGDDTVTGGDGDDAVSGGDGADLLRGQAGHDLMFGDAGNDRLLGGGGNDTLDGGDGDDLLQGNGGGDAMSGGTGNDIYLLNSAGDTVTELPGEGTDEVRVAGISYTLGDNVENLRILSGPVSGTGNGLANEINGSNGNNTIAGLGANDTLRGRGGSDTIDGGDGNDIIAGNAGQDFLTGGAGADRFVFTAITDSAAGAVNAEVITDFSQAQGDRIQLTAIDAIPGGADNPFAFIGTAAFSGTAGELRYRIEGGTGDTIVELDVNGDGLRDMSIRLDGTHNLVAGDFVL
jgi:Ca2+-binding RTX toxin-like protein